MKLELQQSEISVQLYQFMIYVLSKIDSLKKYSYNYKDWKEIVNVFI